MGLEVGLLPATHLLQSSKDVLCAPKRERCVFGPRPLLACRWCDIGYIAVFVQVPHSIKHCLNVPCIHWHHGNVLIAVLLQVQFVGATLFEASVIVGAPYVIAGKWNTACAPCHSQPDRRHPHADNFCFAAEESASNWWTWDAAYWALQVHNPSRGVVRAPSPVVTVKFASLNLLAFRVQTLGAWGFIISAIIFMFEVGRSCEFPF